jgi:hypothetical protein
MADMRAYIDVRDQDEIAVHEKQSEEGCTVILGRDVVVYLTPGREAALLAGLQKRAGAPVVPFTPRGDNFRVVGGFGPNGEGGVR